MIGLTRFKTTKYSSGFLEVLNVEFFDPVFQIQQKSGRGAGFVVPLPVQYHRRLKGRVNTLAIGERRD